MISEGDQKEVSLNGKMFVLRSVQVKPSIDNDSIILTDVWNVSWYVIRTLCLVRRNDIVFTEKSTFPGSGVSYDPMIDLVGFLMPASVAGHAHEDPGIASVIIV